MTDYITALEVEFERNSNPGIAREQKAYMRNQFDFFGIKSPLRKELVKPFLLKEYLPEKQALNRIIQTLWLKPQREYQYFSQELACKYKNQLAKGDIKLFEFMVTHKSWWDTVDFIAVKLMGAYFKKFPEEIDRHVRKWLASENMWLQRSALLFQLNYKNELDTELLRNTVNALLGSKEFFINKAIGWVLRQYSKTNPAWVISFVNKTTLHSLSKRSIAINQIIITLG